MSLPMLSLLLLVLLPASLSQPVARIVFPKWNRVPDGWTHFSKDALAPGAEFGNGGPAAPPEFHFFVKQSPSFVYTLPLPPGLYSVHLGFYERSACEVGKRVFYIQANNVRTRDIDIYNLAGCKKPLIEVLDGVLVGPNAEMVIKSHKIAGYKTILSNFEVFAAGPPTDPSADPSTSALSTPTASVTAAPSTSALSNPTPSVTAAPSPAASPQTSVSASVTSPSESASPSVVPIPTQPPSDQPVARIAFPKFNVPDGWTKYDGIGVEPGSEFGTSGDQTIPIAYRSHIKNRAGFTYTHTLKEGAYDVKLGFLEYISSGCVLGKREFTAYVNDVPAGTIDAFAQAGCRKPLDVIVKNVIVGADGKLRLKMVKINGYAPFLANFEVFVHDSNAAPSPSPPSSSPPAIDLKINVGAEAETVLPIGITQKYDFPTTVKTGPGYAPDMYYMTARYGKDFMYSFDLAPGAYDITLGFAETYVPHCMDPGKRVFKVYVNGNIQLEAYDIFAQHGCFNAHEKTFLSQTVGSVVTKPLTIHFMSTADNAQIAYIRIKTAVNQCTPASSNGELKDSDHAAHAVPGSYPPQLSANAATSYVDSRGDGFVTVRIDGKGSHTHFFDSLNGIIGEITEYKWTLVETGQIISTKQAFSYDIPLGSTRLKLAVLDNSCTRDEAETTVTVTGAIQPGQYCYYYQGLEEPLVGGTLLDSNVSPSFAAISDSLSLNFPSFDFDQTMFGVRCLFFLHSDVDSSASKISIETGGSGIVKVYKGQDLIIDSISSKETITSLAVGLVAFEVIYLRTADVTVPAKLEFKVDGMTPANSRVSHDRQTVLPILSALSPHEGQISGGTQIKVKGYGLFQPLTVMFGGKQVSVSSGGESPTQFFVVSPQASTPDAVPVVVKTPGGASSNSVFFSYGSSCDSVKFKEASMRHRTSDSEIKDIDFLKLPTCAILGHDGKIYMGTLGGTVQVLGYHSDTLIVNSHCYSKKIKDSKFTKNNEPADRDILGITIDPRDVEIRPYVSTSTLYWLDKKRLDNSPINWRNGAVDRLKPGTEMSDPKVCLVMDKRIISNLPVSNHDHSVNALMFDQKGDLLISVGGFTNMGLPGYKLGGYWETHLSAAVLIARTSLGDVFNGNLEYTTDLVRHAMLKKGDVEIFATGIRNGFAMTLTRNGNMYLADQGPNCAFGDTATDCDADYDEQRAKNWDPSAEINWQGLVKHGWNNCPYAVGRPDKVLHLSEGAYYGHPNVQRGLQIDESEHECYWVDPYTGLPADKKKKPSLFKYKKPLELFKSPVTGIAEYQASHFCSKLRGNLILSTYKDGKTYRLGVDGSKVTREGEKLSDHGGLTFVENARGDLVFPRLSKKNVFVLRPDVSMRAELFVTGVAPVRHGKNGGTMITVAGQNFGMDPSVMVGGNSCAIAMSSKTEIKCMVPAGSGLVDVEVVAVEGESGTLANAVLYMEVG